MPLYFGNQTVTKQLFTQQLTESPPPVIAIDCETISVTERWPLTFAIAVSPDEAWTFECYPEVEREVELVLPLLRNPSIKKVYHNAPFDMRAMPLIAETDRSNIADTLVMAHILGYSPANLEFLAPIIGKVIEPASDTLARLKAKTMLEVPPIERAVKCSNDAKATLGLYYKFLPEVMQKVSPEYVEVENKVIPVLIDMGLKGLKIDQEERARLETKARADVEFYRKLCSECEDGEFNPACLHPSTRVLTSDLSWKPISDVQIGDKLIGIDEEPHPGKGQERKMQESIVEAKASKLTDAYIITFGSDQFVIAGAEHPWLQVGKKQTSQDQSATRWISTDKLQPGMRLKFLAEPWEYDTSREAGYLAGILDGEGSVSKWHLSFYQTLGAVADEYVRLIQSKGYKLTADQIRPGNEKQKASRAIRIITMEDMIRLIGSVRPVRLLAKSSVLWNDKAVHNSKEITSITRLPGQMEMTDIKTSTKTFIAEGLFTHNSNQQVGFILAKRGNWLPFTRSKRSLKTDEETLEFLDDPLAAVILNFRKMSKALNTYIEPLGKEDRLFTEYYLDTDVGRTSSRNRNIQNIPDGQKPPYLNMRTMIMPDSGCFTTGDFAQEHLYILMHNSGDPAMKRVYEDGEFGGDIHQFAAEQMGIPRKIAKTINYAVVYGADAHTISVQSKIKDIKKCSKFLDLWFETFKGAAEWIREAQNYGIRHNWSLPTLFGRSIKLPDEANWRGDIDIEAKKRKAVNFPILGTDGEVIKRALLICKEKNLPLALQVHDSITCDGDIQFPIEQLEHITPVRIPFVVSKSERWQ